MAIPIKINWRSRFDTIVELFNRESFNVCELELRALLAHHHLPRYYRIRCLIILAQCEDDWNMSKHHQWCAETIWNQMNTMWPSESTDDTVVIKRLRVMLDSLGENMIADRPEDLDKLDGGMVEEIQKEDAELLAGAAEEDLSKEAIQVPPQGQNKRKLVKIPGEPASKSRQIVPSPFLAFTKKKAVSLEIGSLKSKVGQKVPGKSK